MAYNYKGSFFRRVGREHVVRDATSTRPYSPMNLLYIGRRFYEYPDGASLRIDNEVDDVPEEWIFDHRVHSLNPIKDAGYDEQCDFIEIMMNLFPKGENTLTKEGVPEVFFEAFEKKPKHIGEMLKGASKDPSYISAQRMIKRVLRSPTLKRVLCKPTNFSFHPSKKKECKIVARIDRGELRDFDAQALAWFLMAHYKGQIILPDGGFYLREMHSRLFDQERLITKVDFLDQLPGRLRQTALLIEEKIPRGATVEDAEELAKYVVPRLSKSTDKYSTFIEDAIS